MKRPNPAGFSAIMTMVNNQEDSYMIPELRCSNEPNQ
jgi:hypothetical protein